MYKYFVPVLVFIFTTFFLNSCTSVPSKATTSPTSQTNKLFEVQPLLGREMQANELPNENIFDTTPEMASFAEAAVANADTPLKKALALHKALVQPTENGGGGIKFNAEITEPASLTFAHKRANCLSFSILFVALSRHLNLDAYINEVDIPPSWDMLNDKSMFFMRHVNAIVRFPSETRGITKVDYVVIDLQLDQYRPSFTQRTLSNDLVEAQYYSNKSTEALAAGNKEQAFLYMSRALQANQQQSYLWNNLAIVYRRYNLLGEAELAYLHGLELKPHDLTIMNNLAALYKDINQAEKAEYYLNLARNYRKANPYQEYSLASSALASGDAKTALVHIQQAINIETKEKRFYQLASTIYRELDQPRRSDDMQQEFNDLVSQGY